MMNCTWMFSLMTVLVMIGVLFTIRYVSARVIGLEQQQQLLQQQINELQHTNSQLKEARHYQSNLLANMSHELRTPLNSIILLAKLLANNDRQHLDEAEIKRATVIHQAGLELLRLINDVLDLAKIEAGRMVAHPQLVDSHDLINDLQRQFEDTAHVKGLEFIGTDHWHGQFITDRDRVGQIIRNLLANAVKFTHVGCVTLSITHQNNATHPVHITVTDTGIGIHHEQLGLIFEDFRQADSSIAQQFGGTGLGLAISLRLAQLLGGTLTVTSTLGVGSAFTLSLPQQLDADIMGCVPQPVSPVNPINEPQISAAVCTTMRTNRLQECSILVVESDPRNLFIITADLEQEGAIVANALDGHQALELLHSAQGSSINLIIIDIMIITMHGGETITAIKADPHLRTIPMIAITAKNTHANDVAAHLSGISDFITKPVDREILINMVEICYQRK